MTRIQHIYKDARLYAPSNKAFYKCMMSFLLTLCFGDVRTGQSTAMVGGGGAAIDVGTLSPPDQPPTLNDPAIQTQRQMNGKFQWHTAMRQAFLYTSVMHAFRIATEPGTRDALEGPWFKDWMASVSGLRGWDDHDPFITNYVAHSLEGSIFGFIQQNNDPRYRDVVWGSGRNYWISRLRALSFSAVMSTQWKIGPASEASLGNVQLHEGPGFADFANTPTIGICEMMGEDIADRYLITALENRTSNRMVLILARSFLKTNRAFAINLVI